LIDRDLSAARSLSLSLATPSLAVT
jgi:hypothetical protein